MRVIGALIVVAILSISCTDAAETPVQSPSPFAEGYELVADQPYLPERSNGLAVLVTRDRHMEPAWRHFQLGGSPASLSEGEEVALFVGTGESSSCPIELEGVTVDDGDVRVETVDPGGPCTADFKPRTFVFLFRSADAPEVDGTVSMEGQDLRIEGLSEVSSL